MLVSLWKKYLSSWKLLLNNWTDKRISTEDEDSDTMDDIVNQNIVSKIQILIKVKSISVALMVKNKAAVGYLQM